MSAPETPVQTEAAQILDLQRQTLAKLDELINALNGLGGNVQWIIDNVQGIFQMFSNPNFMGQLSGMMGGMAGGGQAAGPADGTN
jgi:hypothetical protein